MKSCQSASWLANPSRLKYYAGEIRAAGINEEVQMITLFCRRIVRLRALGRQLRRGQTLVEYALIIAVMSIVAIGVLISLGQQTKNIYTAITSQISRGGS
jgi:Flp pilus assembly pilin Flp